MLKLGRKKTGPRDATANWQIAFRFQASSKVPSVVGVANSTSDVARIMFRNVVSVEAGEKKLDNKVMRWNSISSQGTSPVESFMI